METQTNSKFLSLNGTDFAHLLKNLLVFVVPMLLANIVPIQNYILTHIGVNPEVLGIILSAIIKLLEYRLRKNQTPAV